MPAKRLLPMLILLLLILPGCFRQAGEAFEPLDENAAQTAPTGIPPTADTGAPGAETATPTNESGLPPVTIISPPTQADTDASETPETAEETSEAQSNPPLGTVEVVETPTTQVFLTPGFAPPITEIAPTQPGAAPSATPSGLITPTALSGGPTGDGCTYTVQPGNTLFSIARNNNIELDMLRQANPEVVGDLIQVGQVLNIPGCGRGVDDQGNPVQPPTATGATNASGQTIHTVLAGETLVRIARQYGVTVQDIVNANNLANPNLLDVGQQLIIPNQ